jgi:hypothetical protein
MDWFWYNILDSSFLTSATSTVVIAYNDRRVARSARHPKKKNKNKKKEKKTRSTQANNDANATSKVMTSPMQPKQL